MTVNTLSPSILKELPMVVGVLLEGSVLGPMLLDIIATDQKENLK